MKNFLIFLILITLTLNICSIKKANAFVVETPTLDTLMSKLTSQLKYDFAAQTAEIINTLITLKSHLEEAKKMAKDISDGIITPDMINFAFNTAKKCGLSTPRVVLKDFPQIDFKICKNPLPYDQVQLNFSFKNGMSAENKKTVLENIAKIKRDNYNYSLTNALAVRSLDRSESIKDYTQQMKNKSLANQAFVANEINLAILSELVEIRKLLGLQLEGQTLDRTNSFISETQEN